MRVAVTGGAGFIGSHVLDKLAAAGHTPVVVDLVPSPHHALGAFDTVIADVTDVSAACDALRGCDAVVHLAAVADVNDVVADPARAHTANVGGTQAVLEAARQVGVRRVVYGSTVWVYGGLPAEEIVDETSPLALPEHLYTATKIAGEMYSLAYSRLYGVESTILRFGIPYGPRARPAAVVPSFVNRALRGEPITIAGDGRQTRQFVYVGDLAEGIVAALRPDAAGRTYNLVGSEETSVREIADAVCALVAEVPIVHVAERPADVHLPRVSGARAADELDWRAGTPFAEGLGRYVDWFTASDGAAAAVASAS
jgi:UDP-glucose 4-epimerase